MGRKFTIFALFFFVFEGKFQVQAPRGAYIRRGDLTGGFLRYDFGGLIFGGAYFRNFKVFSLEKIWINVSTSSSLQAEGENVLFPLGFANRQVKINIILAPNLHGFFLLRIPSTNLLSKLTKEMVRKWRNWYGPALLFLNFIYLLLTHMHYINIDT